MTDQCDFLYKVKAICKYQLIFHVDNTSQSWSCDHPECQQRSLNFKMHLSSQIPKLSPINDWKYL